jgi:hypothetical protein
MAILPPMEFRAISITDVIEHRITPPSTARKFKWTVSRVTGHL